VEAVQEGAKEQPTVLDNVLAIANSLKLTDVQEIETVGAETTLDRREWRIIANTGELRGICWRQRNKDRKVTRYVGKRNNPEEFRIYQAAYEGWRRANRSFAGLGIVPAVDPKGAGGSKSPDG
jgi:hypothetical protein